MVFLDVCLIKRSRNYIPATTVTQRGVENNGFGTRVTLVWEVVALLLGFVPVNLNVCVIGWNSRCSWFICLVWAQHRCS